MADHICLDIEDSINPLVNAMRRKLQSLSEQKNGITFSPARTRIPSFMMNDDLYKPRIVSIGPYHRGKEKYRAMEELKWQYLLDFFCRSNRTSEDCNFSKILADFISKIKDMEEYARQFYDGNVISLDSDKFVQMLLLDGCFILEILVKWQEGKVPADISSRISYIRSDLLLLENQLPFFVITELFCKSDVPQSVPEEPMQLFRGIASKFLIGDYQESYPASCSKLKKDINHSRHLLEFFHILSVLKIDKRNSYINKFDLISRLKHHLRPYQASCPILKDSVAKEPHPSMLSATWLVKAGMKFENTRSSRSLFHVVFEKGTLRAPTLRIDSEHMSLLSNLMVFEALNKELKDRIVSSYVLLMDSLIDTSEDVELLKGYGFINNTLESNQAAAAFFNSLGAHCIVDPKDHYYAPLIKRVSELYRSKWNHDKASFISKYFDSPWAGISLCAATTLLFFSGLQTYYTIAAYYHHN